MSAAHDLDRRALSRNMRAALRSSGLTIGEAARAIGVSRAAMSNYLSGMRCPDGIALWRFATLTQTCGGELFEGIEGPR